MNGVRPLAARGRRFGVCHGWAILSALSLMLVVVLACSSIAKTETTSLCDALITSLPAGAPCPPVPVGGFDELAELVRYPEMFVKAGIEGTLWIELEALPDSSGRIVKATGPGSEFPKLFGPIFDAIESLKWLRCSIRGTGDTGEQDPVPFPINLQLQAADTHIDTAVTLPGGGVRLMASRILIRDPGSGYAGGPHP